MERVLEVKCKCGEDAVVENHHGELTCEAHETKRAIAEEQEEECEYCGGEGYVATDEFDRDSGQYMRGVGEAKCVCRIEAEADEDKEKLTDLEYANRA